MVVACGERRLYDRTSAGRGRFVRAGVPSWLPAGRAASQSWPPRPRPRPLPEPLPDDPLLPDEPLPELPLPDESPPDDPLPELPLPELPLPEESPSPPRPRPRPRPLLSSEPLLLLPLLPESSESSASSFERTEARRELPRRLSRWNSSSSTMTRCCASTRPRTRTACPTLKASSSPPRTRVASLRVSAP